MITVSLTFIVLFSFNCLFNSGIHKGRQHKGQLLDLSLLNRDISDIHRKLPDGKTVVYKTVCPYDPVKADASRPRCLSPNFIFSFTGYFFSQMRHFPESADRTPDDENVPN